MTGGNVMALLSRLEAVGVVVSLNDTGDGVKVKGKGKAAPGIMEDIRAHKPALLAYLRGEEVEAPALAGLEDVTAKEGQIAPTPSESETLPAFSPEVGETHKAPEAGPSSSSPKLASKSEAPKDTHKARTLPESETLPASSSPALTLEGLPSELREVVEAARSDLLPKGAQSLASGLVMDLGGYVLAWAESWPRDKAHVLRRLEEARQVWKPRAPIKLEKPDHSGQGAA